MIILLLPCSLISSALCHLGRGLDHTFHCKGTIGTLKLNKEVKFFHFTSSKDSLDGTKSTFDVVLLFCMEKICFLIMTSELSLYLGKI